MTPALTVAAVIFLIVLGRLPPVIVISSKIIPETVEPGQMIEIVREIKSERPDCYTGIITATIVDSHRVIRPLEPIKASKPPATGTTGSTWVVPKSMPSGPAIYRSTVEYSCAPLYDLWPVTVMNPGIEFFVNGPDDPPPVTETPAPRH